MSLQRWVVKGCVAPEQPPGAHVAAASMAAAVGLVWPQPPRGRGKPSRRRQWQDLLYARIRRGGPLPPGVTAEPPSDWVVGRTLDELALTEEDVVAVAAARHVDAATDDEEDGPVHKRRKRTHVHPEVKDWFLDFHRLQPKGTAMSDTLRRAPRMLPEALAALDRSTVYRWGSLPTARRGRPKELSSAHLTLLAEVVERIGAQLPATTLTYQFVFKRVLDEHRVGWVPSRSWIRSFRRMGGWSYNKPGGCSLTNHPVERQTANLRVMRCKLVYAMTEHNVSMDRVINLDETAVRLLPTASYGWSVKGQKPVQLQSGKSVTTGTVALAMDEQTPAWLQVIFQGKTSAVLPDVRPEVLSDRVQMAFTPSHWQTTESLQAFVLWLDSLMHSPPFLPTSWILVMDLASSHHSHELQLPEHTRVLFIPPGATSYLQPLGRSIFRQWKSKLTNAANQRLADIALGPEPLAESFGFTLPALKSYIVMWTKAATEAVQASTDARKKAWKHLLWANDEEKEAWYKAGQTETGSPK